MNNFVDGKVIAITGAGSQTGFGRLTADRLVKLGAKLVLSDINAEQLGETVAAVKSLGGEVIGVAADVAKYEDNLALVKQAVDTFGRLDVFIANAGIMPLAKWEFHEKALESWGKCIDINLKGVMYAISAIYDQMCGQEGGGQFIALSSIFSKYPVIGGGVYQATKIGINYMVNTLRQESFGKIKTSLVYPTGINTTNLNKTVIDGMSGLGIHGWNGPVITERYTAAAKGESPAETRDINSIQNYSISGNEVADALVYLINQPMGLNIAEITVRASNETHIL